MSDAHLTIGNVGTYVYFGISDGVTSRTNICWQICIRVMVDVLYRDDTDQTSRDLCSKLGENNWLSIQAVQIWELVAFKYLSIFQQPTKLHK